MTQDIKYKPYKYKVNQKTYYEILPDYNVSRTMKPATIEEVQKHMKEWEGKTDTWSRDYLKALRGGLSKIQTGQSDYVAKYTMPWGEKATFVPKSQIAEIEKAQREGLPIISPEQYKAQRATLGYKGASEASGEPMRDVSRQSGQYDHPAIKTRDLIIAGQPITVWRGDNPQAGVSYQIQPGDTLTSIASKFGTTIDNILKANKLSTTPTASSAVSSVIPPFEKTGFIDTTGERADQKKKELEEAERRKKELQDDADELEKLTIQEQIRQKREALGLDPETGEKLERPPVLQQESTHEALRSEHGLEALETRMNDLNKLIEDTEASLRQGLYDVEGKLMPMELIGTRQRELQRQAQETLDTYRREQQTLIDQYNTKIGIINTVMNLKQMDYNASVADYNAKFNESLKLYDLIQKEDKENKNVALANLTTLSDYLGTAIQTGAMTADTIPEDTKNMISKLELQSGQIPGITMALLEVTKPKVNKLATVTSDDKSTVSVLYNDGTVQTFNTGITGGVSAGFKFSSDDKGRLLEVGLTNEEITNLQNDINQAGLNVAIEGSNLSDEQQTKIRNILKGLTSTEEENGKEFLTQDYIKSTFDMKDLKKAAYKKGYRKGGSWFFGLGVGEEGVNEYLDYLINKYVPAQRKAGYTDNEILQAIAKQISE